MIKIVLIGLSLVLISAVLAYTWINRDSDRVVLTCITALFIGSIGFVTKESISNKLEEFKAEFPIVAFYGLPTYREVNISLPYTHELAMLIQNIDPDDLPKPENDQQANYIDIGFGDKMYFEALQYLIIKNFADQYNRSWNINFKKLVGPGSESMSWQSIKEKGTTVDALDLLNQLENNYFVQKTVPNARIGNFGNTIHLPPDATIKPVLHEHGHEFRLEIKTSFIEMTIKLSRGSSSVGIGEYEALLSGKPVNTPISANAPQPNGHSTFIMEIEGKQHYFKNGHPEMKKQRKWADSIIEHFSSKFDFTKIKTKHREKYQLYGPAGIVKY